MGLLTCRIPHRAESGPSINRLSKRFPRRLNRRCRGLILVPIAQNTERECPKLQVAGEIPTGDANSLLIFD